MQGGLYIGTSGWTYDDWNGVFYPPEIKGAERLSYYAGHFNTVEVNATFYRLLAPTMIKAWNRRLDPGYQLVLKGHRAVTHFKRLVECQEVLNAFLERASQLLSLKVVLWQLPPSFKRNDGVLDAFLASLPDSYRYAMEFRHPSWWHPEVGNLLTKRGAAFVAISHPRLPDTVIPTTDFLYLRFHGLGKRLYDYDYSVEQLAGWVDRLSPNLAGRRLYAFFNNDYNACALNNARTFRDLLARL